jgi:serine/threonine protein kinase
MCGKSNDRLEEIFSAAIELDETRRAAFLDEACGDDTQLRARVVELLAGHQRSDSVIPSSDGAFDEADTQDWAAAEDRRDDAPQPDQVGPYEIVRELARGGMGVVYLGFKEEGRVRRMAAIKVLKRGMDTDAILKRFQTERQVLSTLHHPNIAHFLEGGTTDDQRPYFALEYIEGEPIDEYCHSHRLQISERLELFGQICSAVHYAHQNLVVHRDLKPSNILVTKEGVPKLLDFGIAKLLNPELAPLAAPTAAEYRLMTPEYSSPEQVQGRPITTASDVYSLGVVLYELVSGCRPYRLETRLHDELVRVICDVDPDRPSTAITRMPSESSTRRWEEKPERLRRQVRGDIDTIVLKAMQKAPQRRYASAEKLAEDIERHLRGYPVTARPDSVSYRVLKFVSRNKAGVAIVALAAVVTLTTLTSLWLLQIAATTHERRVAESARADREAAEADAQKARAEAMEVLNEMERERAAAHEARAERLLASIRHITSVLVIEFDEALRTLPGATAVRGRMVETAVQFLVEVDAEAADDPQVRRELAGAYSSLGEALFGVRAGHLGDVDGAIKAHRKALALRQAALTDDPEAPGVTAELARSHKLLGDVLRNRDAKESLTHYRAARDLLESIGVATSSALEPRSDWAECLLNIGTALYKSEPPRLDEAIGFYRQSLRVREENAERWPDDPDVMRDLAVGCSQLSAPLAKRGEFDDAADLRERSLSIRRELFAANPESPRYRRDLGVTLYLYVDALLRMDERDLHTSLDLLSESRLLLEPLWEDNPQDSRAKQDMVYVFTLVDFAASAAEQADVARDARERLQALRAADRH